MLRFAAAALRTFGTCALSSRRTCRTCRTYCTHCANAPSFDFTRTLRVDYLHTGGPKGETIELDAVVAEGEWPGSHIQLIDTTDLGKYIFEVIDLIEPRPLLARVRDDLRRMGNDPEFRTTDRTFHESLRFPRPNAPVRIVIKKRDPQKCSRRSGRPTSTLRPQSPRLVPLPSSHVSRFCSKAVHRGVRSTSCSSATVFSRRRRRNFVPMRHGSSRRCSRSSPSSRVARDFNVRALQVRGTPVSVQFNIFGLERYALTYEIARFARLPPSHRTMSSKCW